MGYLTLLLSIIQQQKKIYFILQVMSVLSEIVDINPFYVHSTMDFLAFLLFQKQEPFLFKLSASFVLTACCFPTTYLGFCSLIATCSVVLYINTAAATVCWKWLRKIYGHCSAFTKKSKKKKKRERETQLHSSNSLAI